MSEAVAYEQFEQAGAPDGGGEAGGDLRRLSEVPVEASVEIGRTGMTVGETLELHVGSVVKLDRLAGEPVDLLVNGALIAQGEVVVVDEQFGLRVTEIAEGDATAAPALEPARAGDGAATPNGAATPDGVDRASGLAEPAATASDEGALELGAGEQAER